MKIPGKNVDDGMTVTYSDLDTIFGTKSTRRYVLEKINTGGTINELKKELGISEESIKKAYFSAYVRCKEYNTHKKNKMSVRYLKAVRKIDKKTSNSLLKMGITNLDMLKGIDINEFFNEREKSYLSAGKLYEICKTFKINSVYNGKPAVEPKEKLLERVVYKLVRNFGVDAVDEELSKYKNDIDDSNQ
ncbi:MAG: hypothetical protein K6G88_02620 [Lachnospiraceae bacterium]|nr:hypothetical protein [Lachnospiraceae bacterium]